MTLPSLLAPLAADPDRAARAGLALLAAAAASRWAVVAGPRRARAAWARLRARAAAPDPAVAAITPAILSALHRRLAAAEERLAALAAPPAAAPAAPPAPTGPARPVTPEMVRPGRKFRFWRDTTNNARSPENTRKPGDPGVATTARAGEVLVADKLEYGAVRYTDRSGQVWHASFRDLEPVDEPAAAPVVAAAGAPPALAAETAWPVVALGDRYRFVAAPTNNAPCPDDRSRGARVGEAFSAEGVCRHGGATYLIYLVGGVIAYARWAEVEPVA